MLCFEKAVISSSTLSKFQLTSFLLRRTKETKNAVVYGLVKCKFSAPADVTVVWTRIEFIALRKNSKCQALPPDRSRAGLSRTATLIHIAPFPFSMNSNWTYLRTWCCVIDVCQCYIGVVKLQQGADLAGLQPNPHCSVMKMFRLQTLFTCFSITAWFQFRLVSTGKCLPYLPGKGRFICSLTNNISLRVQGEIFTV